jgi:hypothetical protein
MAAVGEAATIAGLLGLAGLAVQAAAKLYTYLVDYRSIHPRVADVIQELERLHPALSEISRAANLAASGAGSPPSSLTLIFTELRSCHECINKINFDLDKVKDKTRDAPQRFLEKLKLAADKDRFLKISSRLSMCRQELMLLLGTSSW